MRRHDDDELSAVAGGRVRVGGERRFGRRARATTGRRTARPRLSDAGAGVRSNLIQSSDSNRSPFHIAVLQVEHAEPGQVAGVRIHLAAQDEVAEPIDAGQRVAHADAVEQRGARKAQVGLVAAERQPHRVHGQQRVVVLVVPVRAGLPNQGALPGATHRTRTGPVGHARPGRILEAGVVDRLEPARHVEHMTKRDGVARVVLRTGSPGQPREAQWFVELHPALVHEHADERPGNALGRGPRPGLRRHVDARRIAFVDDPAAPNDQQAEGHLLGRLTVEGPIRGGLQRGGRSTVSGMQAWITALTSDLSIPKPNADVATTTSSSPRRHSSITSDRTSADVAPWTHPIRRISSVRSLRAHSSACSRFVT